MGNGAVDTPDVEKAELQALPYQEPLRTWAGRGSGVRCNLCGAPIRTQDIEYEVELHVPAGDSRGLHFHFNCYRLWESQS
jgi:hypothetical protein